MSPPFTLAQSGKKLKSSNVILPASYSIVSNLSNFHKSPNTPRHLRFREVIKKTIGIKICVLFITGGKSNLQKFLSWSQDVWLWVVVVVLCKGSLGLDLFLPIHNDVKRWPCQCWPTSTKYFFIWPIPFVLAFLTLHQKTAENSCLITIFSGPNRNVSFLKIQCTCLSRSW